MEGLNLEHGVLGLLIILALQFVLSLFKLLWAVFKGKEKSTDAQITKIDLTLTQFDNAVRELRVQIGLFERELIEVHKFKADSQKLFSAIKIMAGKDWPKIRKAMEEDALPE